MVRIIAILLGVVAMLVVIAAGYSANVSTTSIIFRSMFAFFIFYMIGNVFGVIILKNTLEVFEKRRQQVLDHEKKNREEQFKQKKAQLDEKLSHVEEAQS